MVKDISCEKAKEMFDKGTAFLDVREQYEYNETHIPGATLIPLSEMNARWQEIPKDKEMIVYCLSGSRSAGLLYQLSQMGYDNLYNMTTGLMEWHQRQFPLDSGAEAKNADDLPSSDMCSI
jgi:rhodanese-related sulfurtransferase